MSGNLAADLIESLEKATQKKGSTMAPKKGSKRTVVERPALDFSSLTVAKAAKETMKSHKPVRGQRDPEQTQIDGIVKAAHSEWVANGKPSEWAEQPGTYLLLPEGQLETLKWRIQRAGQFYDFKIRFSNVEIEERELTDENGDPVYLTDDDDKLITDDDGDPIAATGKFAEVVFVATDKPEKTS